LVFHAISSTDLLEICACTFNVSTYFMTYYALSLSSIEREFLSSIRDYQTKSSHFRHISIDFFLFLYENIKKGGNIMKIKKALRIFIGSNVLVLLTFGLLPALLVNPDIDLIQSFINYIGKD
jgi:hypothetical protein